MSEKNIVKAVEPEQKRYRVQFDFNYAGTPGKKMDPESKVQPNMSLTIKQMVQGHRKAEGGDLIVSKPLEYITEVPAVSDLNDLKDLQKTLESQISNIKSTLKMREAEVEAKKAEKEAMVLRMKKIEEDQKANKQQQ